MKNKLLIMTLMSVLFVTNIQSSFLSSLSDSTKMIGALVGAYALYDIVCIFSDTKPYEQGIQFWEIKNNISVPQVPPIPITGNPQEPRRPENFSDLDSEKKRRVENKFNKEYTDYLQMLEITKKQADRESARYNQHRTMYVEARKFIYSFPTAHDYASLVASQARKDRILKNIIIKPLIITSLALLFNRYCR